jgi:integrase
VTTKFNNTLNRAYNVPVVEQVPSMITLPGTRVTAGEFPEMIDRMKEYLRNEKKTYTLSPETVATRVGHISALHRKTGGVVFSQDWIKMVRGLMVEQEKRPTTSIRDYLYAVEDFFAANGHPVKIAKPRVTEKVEVVWYEHKDVLKIIEKGGNGLRDTAILSTMYYAGVRNTELRYLWVDDVRLKDRKVLVRDHGQGIKNYQERAIPLPKAAMPVLEDYAQARKESEHLIADPNIFFPSTTSGGVITRSGLCRFLKRAGKRAGFPDLHAHALRHSRATFLANHPTHPMPIPQLQRLMGHKSITTTMRYLHSTYEEVEKTISRIDA